jgi:hypothetical protein
MFNSIRNWLNRADDHQADKRELEAEAKQFKLPSETLPQLLKYIFFAGLAVLNFRLFAHAVPGAWGIGTGIVACMAELIAIYSTHNFSRSAGLFRAALGLSGALLMGFSLVHGTFSIMDLIGVKSLSRDIHFYSSTVAFPLLAALVGLSVIALTMTHPKNLVRLKQAAAHMGIVVARAEAASQMELMRATDIIEQARLNHFTERTRRQGAYLSQLQNHIAIEEKTRALIAGISDPQLREALACEMGIPDPGHQQQRPTRNLGFPTAQDNGPKSGRGWI